MRKYAQEPSGWWQDAKHRMQPPGSYRDATLRLGGEPVVHAGRRSAADQVRRLFAGVQHRGKGADIKADDSVSAPLEQ